MVKNQSLNDNAFTEAKEWGFLQYNYFLLLRAKGPWDKGLYNCDGFYMRIMRNF